MAIFNKKYTLSLLNEMKSKEEYARRSFKKKYKFEPDKPGSNTGEITVDGKKYKVNISKNNKFTNTSINSSSGKIRLDKKFFKLKGSNNNERRDAIL